MVECTTRILLSWRYRSLAQECFYQQIKPRDCYQKPLSTCRVNPVLSKARNASLLSFGTVKYFMQNHVVRISLLPLYSTIVGMRKVVVKEVS